MPSKRRPRPSRRIKSTIIEITCENDEFRDDEGIIKLTKSEENINDLFMKAGKLYNDMEVSFNDLTKSGMIMVVMKPYQNLLLFVLLSKDKTFGEVQET